VILVGCGGQPTRSDLHKAARSATPAQATIVLEKEADCVQGSRFPSCVEIWFRLGHRPLTERLNTFVSAAQRNGWTTRRSGSGGGEVFVRISKGKYKGIAGFWLDRYYKPDGHCDPLGKTAGGPVATCADLLSVQWGGHPLGSG
jgi:hypothetical protein